MRPRFCAAALAVLLVLGGSLEACRHNQTAPPPAQTIATEYDLVYAIGHARMGTHPSPFLVSLLGAQRARPDATALDIGSGNGRNSLYLARLGYHVTAVDLSRIGLDLTRQAAQAGHLPVNTVAQDINNFDFGQSRWDVILLIDFPFPYRPLLPKIAASLKPDGLVVVQDVAKWERNAVSPDGVLHYTFMDPDDLKAPFAGFRVLHREIAQQHTIWGVQALMIRYAARKPGGSAP